LALAFPAAAGSREGLFYTHLVEMPSDRGDSAIPTNGKKGHEHRQLFSKEKTMTYTKPEVVVFGKAVRVIENVIGKLWIGMFDGAHPPLNRLFPAYNFDE
jgi:hypothetical protein